MLRVFYCLLFKDDIYLALKDALVVASFNFEINYKKSNDALLDLF
jgi:hypothetical protein